MSKAEQRIKEVLNFFHNSDTVLGYRKLMDCAIDTQDLDIYNEVITLTDWKEKFPENEIELVEKSKSLLEKIRKIPIPEHRNNHPIIEAENVIKSYGKNRFNLGPISLSITKGQVYGLVGENGNGKTTLLRVLAKELACTSGQLSFRFDDNTYSNYDLRTHLVYIPQRTNKWYGSLKDNLKFVLSNYGVPPEENETRVLMMIARLGLWNYKHLKWSELSSGYKMRFELARTLLRKPELLLLDEPLANLDILSQQVILEDLKSICSSINNPIALILSSQQLYEVEKVSDKVIYLKNGKHLQENTHETTSNRSNNPLIIEIDCNCDREELNRILKPLQLEKLIFNGGVFIASFRSETPYYSVLKTLGENEVEVTYTRNITNSSRRFFVS